LTKSELQKALGEAEAKDMDTHTPVYDLRSVKLPYLSGPALRLFVGALEGPLRPLLLPNLFQSAGITEWRKLHFDEAPIMEPFYYVSNPAGERASIAENEWPEISIEREPGFHFANVHDYARAYRDGETSPLEVAERVLNAIETSNAADPPLRAIIALIREDVERQAQESTQRFQAGRPLSVFDGVPVAVKDEVDMKPYPTSVGTAFLGAKPAERDSTVVARMRAAGALLIGKANMHEIGIGVTGLNPHHGTPRNPYNPAHYTGGSSSGPAAATASGLCPVAIGADGGGSIRIPASFCGLVGLKPTYGRISEFGAAPLTWSMAHLGPLAANATDAALAYAVLAGPDTKDPHSLHQPTPKLTGWDNFDLSDLTMGVYWPWFRHAAAEVVQVCELMLEILKHCGAKLKEITIPDLEAARVAHTVIIAGEMTQALNWAYDEHHKEFGLDVRANLALARQFTTRDYLQSQQVRARLMGTCQRILGDVDVIISPATAVAAPPIPAKALPDGESDLSTLVEIMRFATPANLTGLPAISFPAGYTTAGLPVGFQAMGRPWQEASLLRLALAAEKQVERRAPKIYFPIL
jgi:Asp-tRNA(Asn)/Glu-tRNA(Gln) amidotransferase A subunit family amidase